MDPGDLAAHLRARLAAELRADLAAIERRGASVATLARAAEPDDGAVRSLALAFELARCSTAVERLVQRAVQGIDGDVPRGDRGHAELLRVASVPVAGLRPEVLSRQAAVELRELLGFRHFARHAYDAEPDPARLAVLAARVATLLPAVRASMAAVIDALEG